MRVPPSVKNAFLRPSLSAPPHAQRAQAAMKEVPFLRPDLRPDGSLVYHFGIMTTARRAQYEVYLPNPPGQGPVTVVRTIGSRRYEYTLPARGLLSFPEAAAALGVTRVTLYRWTKGPRPRIRERVRGGRRWIPVSEIKRFVLHSRRTPAGRNSTEVAPKTPGGKVIGYGGVAVRVVLDDGKEAELYWPDGVVEARRDGSLQVWSASGRQPRPRKPPTGVRRTRLLQPVEHRKGGEKRGPQVRSRA